MHENMASTEDEREPTIHSRVNRTQRVPRDPIPHCFLSIPLHIASILPHIHVFYRIIRIENPNY